MLSFSRVPLLNNTVQILAIRLVIGAEVFGQAHVDRGRHKDSLAPFRLDDDGRSVERKVLSQAIYEGSFDREVNFVRLVGKHDECWRTDGGLGDVVDSDVALELQRFDEPV